jgi:nitroreductase
MANTPLPLPAVDAALRRRSVRRYTADPVPEALLTTLLSAMARAPSANNTQPWRVVVVRDHAQRQALMAAANNQPQVGEAPVVLALYTDMEDVRAHLDEVVHPDVTPERRARTIASLTRTFGAMSPAERAAWGQAQGGIALGYLLLCAESLGLGTSPMLGFDAERVRALLDIPAHGAINALVALGVPNEPGSRPHRHPLARIVSWR